MLFIFSELFQLLYQLVEKRSKLVGLFGILILGYLAGSADPATTSDYDTYQMVYSNSNNGLYFERGYSYLSSFFFNRGWSYLDFRVLFCILASIILYIGVVRFTSNVAIFVFLYGITAFFIDATQVRNFMMVSLVILGSSFLIRLNLKNCMISVFFILLAAEFQSIGYVFLLIVLLRVLSKTLSPKAYKYSLVAVFALTAFIMLMVLIMGTGKFINILTKMSILIGSRGNLADKISGQYTYGTTIRKLFLILFTSFLGLLTTFRLRGGLLSDSFMDEKLSVLYTGATMTFLCVPLLFLAVDYSRIQRAGFLFVILSIAIFSENKRMYKNKWILTSLIILTCLVSMFTYNYIWGDDFIRTIPYLMKIVR